MPLPESSHVVWKIILIVVMFTGLVVSKYVCYSSFDEIKDLRASLVETIGIAMLWTARSVFGGKRDG